MSNLLCLDLKSFFTWELMPSHLDVVQNLAQNFPRRYLLAHMVLLSYVSLAQKLSSMSYSIIASLHSTSNCLMSMSAYNHLLKRPCNSSCLTLEVIFFSVCYALNLCVHSKNTDLIAAFIELHLLVTTIDDFLLNITSNKFSKATSNSNQVCHPHTTQCYQHGRHPPKPH
ncbi:hypothetical protein AAHE18_12G102900 [Arachis hypogaea]